MPWEQQRPAGRDQLRHLFRRDLQAVLAFPVLRFLEPAALVAATQDRDTAAPVPQRLCQKLHHRRLARAADRQVSDADHQGAQVVLLPPALAVDHQAGLHHRAIDAGQGAHGQAHHAGAEALRAAENHIGAPALQFGQRFLHPRRQRNPEAA